MIAITAGAISIAFFSVLAPLIGDPSGRLFALDAAPVIPSGASFGGDPWPVRAFEFTPSLLGPAITNDLLSLADSDSPVLVMMPVLEIRALPPVDDDETSPRG
jgi:hypothetical protein